MKKNKTGWLIALICLAVISALLWLSADRFWMGLTGRMEDGILLCLPEEISDKELEEAKESGWDSQVLEQEDSNFLILLHTENTGNARLRECEQVTLSAFGREMEGECLNLSLHKAFLMEFSFLCILRMNKPLLTDK